MTARRRWYATPRKRLLDHSGAASIKWVESHQHLIRLACGQFLAAETWPGAGPTLVLLHAGVCDRRSWRATAGHLSALARVVAYDRRGYGDSEPSATATSFRHVDDLFAVLDHTVDEPAWLVASSAGARVALDAALLAPERVAGLVLLAPAPIGAPAFEQIDPDTERLDALVDAALASGDVVEAVRLELWLWLDGPAGPEGRVGGSARDLALDMNEIILRRHLSEEQGLSDLNHWAEAPRVGVPIVVAWGDLDVPVLNERCAALAARLPRAQTTVLPGMAHFPYLERPELVADLIADTLRRAA